jgi:choline dehydrogenase-like flavoprotein
VASAASSLVVGRLTRLPDGWSDLVEPAAALGHDLVPLPMAKGAPWMAARRGTEFNSWTSIIDPLTDDHRALQLPAHPVYMTRCAPDRSDPLIARSWTIGLASRGDRPKTYVGLRGTRFAAQVFDTMVPTPDHRVRLDDGPVDALGQRRLRIRITYDQQVRRTMIGARDRLREVFAGAEYHLRPSWTSTRRCARGSPCTTGARCDARRPTARHGRRRQPAARRPNVYVVDQSAFTTGPEKNPTLTAMAIAARAMTMLPG